MTIGGLTTLAALALLVLAHPLVELLLKGDKFGADDVNLTATVLTAYALSIPFDSLSYPLSRALYATHNTLLQVVASLAGFGTILAVAGEPRRTGRDRRDPDRGGRRRRGQGRAARLFLAPGCVGSGSTGRRGRPRRPATSRAGLAARSGPRDGRLDDDEVAVATRVLALGPLPRQEVAIHLGAVLERARRVGLAPDRRESGNHGSRMYAPLTFASSKTTGSAFAR